MTSVARRREQDDSGEYSDASQDIEQNNSGNDGGQPESDYDSRGSDSEHSDREEESQDGQTERRVDDDEDRSNPQYIPKRGTFYEHDDRTAASGEESSNVTSETASEKKEGSETPSERRRAPRKSETINKWSHDKYNENEQMPKSRDELVSIYGYDIRNEDAPPHARRNRRYGRGPNKYTRTWEDEEAYKRQTAAAAQHRKPPNPEDFPELDGKFTRRSRARPRSKSQPASNESSENGSQLRRNASIKTPKGKPAKQNLNRTMAAKPSPKPAAPKDKMPPLENLTITASVFNNSNGPQRKVSAAAVAQQRPVPTEQGKRKPQQPLPQPAATAPNKQQQQQQGPPQQQQHQQQQKTQQNQQSQQATTGNEPRGGSKRYSSLRQRPLAETYSPQQTQQQKQQAPQPQQHPQQQPQQTQQQQQPQQQQQHRYHGDYVPGAQPGAAHQGSPVPQIHPQQMMHQVHRNQPVSQAPHGPSPPHQLPLPQPVPIPPAVLDHTQQQVRLGILEQQQMVSHPHHTMHQPHSIGQLQPAQGYAPPAIMPAQYMQQQSNSGTVYGGAMYQPPAAYPHQMYPHHNYQATQAGGVTYYSCAEQEQQPRAQRRPTAAIPIVRPAAPAAPAAADRPANSTEKDNIDRIVENMFVRKPWPATHGADSKDKPSDQRSSQEPPSKDSSQPNSLTSSSISTDSKPSEPKDEDKGLEALTSPAEEQDA
ncbi:uncharacterized protein [Epargyreus clarus]|uniref:uncharacterized protein isoform X3 n=1 Tax=Epargyreus clarus TaxID=520877 RepID=UPI003C2E191A